MPKQSFWNFKLSEAELKEQVDKYNDLAISKSYRGISALLLAFAALLTLAFILFGSTPSVTLWDVAATAIIAYLVYRGYAWAFIAAIIFWTLEKAYGLYTNTNLAIVSLIWWFLYIQTFYKGYQVAKERIKLRGETKKYCSSCGHEIFVADKFCNNCGQATNVKRLNKKKVGITSAVTVIIILLIVIFAIRDRNTNNSSQSSQNTAQDIISQADYSEGYKSGYVDGRSYVGKLGDNYLPPATVERKPSYTQGYLDGFMKGCNEGNFDCTSIENYLRQQTVPSSVITPQ